jgi:hypothetical protein
MVLHKQRRLTEGVLETEIDEEMFDLIRALRQAGLDTQSCCQQDHISYNSIPLLSEHAYVGFGNSRSAELFVQGVLSAFPELSTFAIEQAVTRRPGFGNGFTTGEHEAATPLGVDLGERWAYGIQPWGVVHEWVGVSLFVAFPRHLIPKMSRSELWSPGQSCHIPYN